MGTDSPGASSHGDRDERLSTTGVVGPRLSHLRSVPVPRVAMSSQLRGTHGTAVGQREQGCGGHGLVGAWLSPGPAKRWQSDAPASFQHGKRRCCLGYKPGQSSGEPAVTCPCPPEPSPDLCHKQETPGSSHLRLEGATCFLVLKKATKHRDQPHVPGHLQGPGWRGDPGVAEGPPAKEMSCPSVQCSITTCPGPRSPARWQQASRDPSPLPPREAPWHPPLRQRGQRLTPWRGRRGSSTGAAGRFAAEPERCWAASWSRLCGGLP